MIALYTITSYSFCIRLRYKLLSIIYRGAFLDFCLYIFTVFRRRVLLCQQFLQSIQVSIYNNEHIHTYLVTCHLRRKGFRRRHLGHFCLMCQLETLVVGFSKTEATNKDSSSLLRGSNISCRIRFPVTQAVYLVNDRYFHIAGQDKVTVK